MRWPIRWIVLLTVIVAAIWFASRTATARADADTHYSLSQTFGAALRYLRVDLGFEVIEKDPEAAYLLFRYRVPGDPKREVPGAIEFVKVEKKVRIFVKIPQMPVLHEQLLRDGLLRKLAQDYGEIGRPAEKPKSNAPDAGSN
jgi:hypothetical protein